MDKCISCPLSVSVTPGMLPGFYCTAPDVSACSLTPEDMLAICKAMETEGGRLVYVPWGAGGKCIPRFQEERG